MRWVRLGGPMGTMPYLLVSHTCAPSAALFLNRSSTRFSVRGIALLVNRYLWAAGVTDRSGPHVLRHTFATHALRARPNLRAVQELLGHAWVTTTQRYTHLEAEDLQAQLAELPANRFSIASYPEVNAATPSDHHAAAARAGSACIIGSRVRGEKA